MARSFKITLTAATSIHNIRWTRTPTKEKPIIPADINYIITAIIAAAVFATADDIEYTAIVTIDIASTIVLNETIEIVRVSGHFNISPNIRSSIRAYKSTGSKEMNSIFPLDQKFGEHYQKACDATHGLQNISRCVNNPGERQRAKYCMSTAMHI